MGEEINVGVDLRVSLTVSISKRVGLMCESELGGEIFCVCWEHLGPAKAAKGLDNVGREAVFSFPSSSFFSLSFRFESVFQLHLCCCFVESAATIRH